MSVEDVPVHFHDPTKIQVRGAEGPRMAPEGSALPAVSDPAKEDPRVLASQVARLNQQLLSERQAAAQTLASERFKCNTEMNKLRATTGQHVKDLENQNSALLQSLGRLKQENDQLQREIWALQSRGSQETTRVQAEPTSSVPVLPPGPPLSGQEIPLPPRP